MTIMTVWQQRLFLVISCMLLTSLFACVSQRPIDPETNNTITLWTIFNTQSPQNDQDIWLAQTIQAFAAEHDLSITHVHQNYAHINSNLSLAVNAGSAIPDLSYVNSQQVPFYINQGGLQDLTSLVQQADWFADLHPDALRACTGPDQRIYCVPGHLYSRLIYYWKDAWPDGFPTDTETLLAEAARLKQADQYALTFKGSEKAAAEGFYFSLIAGYGGQYANAAGAATWATPETAQAVAFVREMYQQAFIPDVVFSPGFDHERAFMTGQAAAFAAGSWSSLYLNPLTAPDGTTFDQGSASVEAALAAGELGLAPLFAAPGASPVVLLTVPSWGIPNGSPNPQQAWQCIDYMMQTQRNADYAIASGGIPARLSAAADPRFDTPYWRFIEQNQHAHGTTMPPLRDYDQGLTLLSETIVRLILQPNLDILTTLQEAQDVYNNN
ncbi:MAG: extracellular solute-binding protein [Chloroflexaceae bacterium]|nr:extracellular solute-binding protein [Chloroflexaceae bacterium]